MSQVSHYLKEGQYALIDYWYSTRKEEVGFMAGTADGLLSHRDVLDSREGI